jgi:hypothetical protein
MRPPARIAAVALAAAVLAAAPAGAPANGDAPSQALATQDVYLPATPPSASRGRELTEAAARAARAGYPVKVAVVRSQSELGTLAEALEEPQRYAEYLATDLARHPSFRTGTAILVVGPTGAGVAGRGLGAGERRAARTVEVSDRSSPDELTREATEALVEMAGAAGHPIGDPAAEGGGGAAGPAIALVALLVAAGVAVGATRARRRAGGPGAGGTGTGGTA